MATLEKRNEWYRVVFCYGGRKFQRSLQTTSEKAANASLGRLEDNLRRISLGILSVPEGTDIASFLLSDGQQAQKPVAKKTLSLKELFELFFANIPTNSLEAETIQGMKIHERHLVKKLGARFRIQDLTLTDLQDYVHKRAKDKGHNGTVTAATIKKAIVTLRTVWNWGVQHGHLHGPFPNKGIKYPKGREKRPFMTFGEIERLAKAVDEKEQAELWECLYLTLPEIREFLTYVKEKALHPFLYPMFVFAAHTGARRAEMLRSKINDIDFAGNMVTIHERKKSHDQITTRRVPMSPLLASVMRSWLSEHPGGENTFCHTLGVERSKTKRKKVCPLTRDEAHDHFKRTLAGSKWSMLRGWHVFRHSFCSNCASRWIDQRLINEWVGHLSEAMVKRYRHLIADQQQDALKLVFGE